MADGAKSKRRIAMILVGGIGGIAIWLIARPYMAASNPNARCSDSGVLSTVRELIEQQNGLTHPVAKPALIMGADTTADRFDRETNSVWCSVSYRVDMKMLSEISEQEFAKTKDHRAKEMAEIFRAASVVSNERRASYRVQPTPDGRHYVTLYSK